MAAKAKEGPYNEDIKRAVRWLRGRGILNKNKDITEKTGYGKSTVSGYITGKIIASADFRKEFEKAFELSLADYNSDPDTESESDTPANVTGDPTVQYVKNQLPVIIKTASGETIEVVVKGPIVTKLLNAFLEERERLISRIEKENEKLTRILESGLIEIKSNLKDALEDLNAIENGQRAQHTVMLHSLERLEKKEPGTLEKELNTLEQALGNPKIDQTASE